MQFSFNYNIYYLKQTKQPAVISIKAEKTDLNYCTKFLE